VNLLFVDTPLTIDMGILLHPLSQRGKLILSRFYGEQKNSFYLINKDFFDVTAAALAATFT
jgi:hypothetical protein